jgi:hypothetical protein
MQNANDVQTDMLVAVMQQGKVQTMMPDVKQVLNGPFLAAMLSAGVGCSVLGICTVLAHASVPIKQLLNFYPPTGPLAGKSTIAVVAWLVTWGILHTMWKEQQRDFRKISRLAFVAVALGIVGTFPLFFDLF